MKVKEMLKCECGVTATVFTSCGTFFAGHFCKKSNSWTTKPLPGIDLMAVYKKKHKL